MTADSTRSAELADFVIELRRRGYGISTEQCIAAQHLVVALAARGEMPERPDDLAPLLAPVLCSSRVEQENFQRLFRQWVKTQPNLFSLTRTAAEKRESPQPLPLPTRSLRPKLLAFKLKHIQIAALLVAVNLVGITVYFTYSRVKSSQQFVSGTVTDTAGRPVDSATIQLIPYQQTSPRSQTLSDSGGSFTLGYQPSDFPVTITAEKSGYMIVELRFDRPGQVGLTLRDDPNSPVKAPLWKVAWRYLRRQRQPAAEETRAVFVISLLLVPVLIGVFLLLLLWLWRIRRAMELRRWRTRNKLKVFDLKVGGAEEQLAALLSLRRTAQEMRRHRHHYSRDLDIRQTVEKTLRAGLFTPAYAARPARPEYLVLIDRTEPTDQQARLAGQIMERLDRSDVFIERYFFQGDPRLCRKDEPGAQFLSPYDLAARHPDHHLVICSDGAGFFHHLTGRPQHWIEVFSKWSSRVLLTPEFDPSDYRNRMLSEIGFSVLPAGREGLMRLGAAAEQALVPAAQDIRPVKPLPELLRSRPARWLESYQPNRDELVDLTSQLQAFLGAEGYLWLGACAVYPQLLWNLTLAFGGLIIRADKLDETFARLLRLPWFRAGSMPDWLRESLIHGLGEREEQLIRDALGKLLESSLKEQPEGFVLPLVLNLRAAGATPSERIRARLRRLIDGWKRMRLFEDLRRTEPDNSPLNDYVLVEFMRGRKPNRLGLRLPESLRPILYPRRKLRSDVYLIWLLIPLSVVACVPVLITAIADPLPGLIIALIACGTFTGLSISALLQLARVNSEVTAYTSVTVDATSIAAAEATQPTAGKQPPPFVRLAQQWGDKLLVMRKLMLRRVRRPMLEQPEVIDTPAADALKSRDHGTEDQRLVNIYPTSRPAFSALHQLPPPPADFTGRSEELAELTREIERGGATISGLQGQGGIGKTALALKLAERLAPRYPDAQFYLDLRGSGEQNRPPLTPAEVMAHVLRAYHPTAKLPEGEADLRAQYLSTLHGQRALLLIDNARDAAQVSPLIPPAGCILLVTSRQHFSLPGLYAKDLDALPPEDARALLLNIAPRIGEHADEIARLCGRLPLALRLAASAIIERKDLSVDDYVRRLNDSRQRLKLIEAPLRLSYDILDAELQRHWRALAVFPSTFDAAAAGAVWRTDVDTTLDALGQLINYSLLDWDDRTARYSMHSLARLFADSRMSSDERFFYQANYTRHYVKVLGDAGDLYDQGGEDTLRGLALFDAEVANIRAGQAWAEKWSADDGAATQLCSDYPRVAATLLSLRQHPRERIRWLEAALASARKLGNKAAEAEHQGNLGTAYILLSEYRRALAMYEQFLSTARESGERRTEAQALKNLGRIYTDLNEPRRAVEFSERALEIYREVGDRGGEGQSLGNLGVAYANMGEMRRAIGFYEEALLIAREVGDTLAEASALGNLGLAYANTGEMRRAIGFYEQRLSISRRIGDRRSEGSALFNMSVALEQLGERARATAHAEAALEIFEDIESPFATQVRERLEQEAALSAKEPYYDDRPSIMRRILAAVVDLLVVAFAASPFAAVIELTSGDWRDVRAAASLAGIVLTIMFIYETVAVAFSGRTWGMRLLSLRAVEARTGLIPTAGQCARRAIFYMLSLATLGVGLLLALFDREGRAIHDRLSRTIVVKE